MKQILAIFTFIIVAGSFFYSCDTIEEPYFDENATVWNGRKVLILDFTGQRCGYCPDGHRTLVQLQQTYPDAIVPVAVHCSFLGLSITDDTTQPFHYDFMTPISIVLGGDGLSSSGYFNISSQPVGTVNSFSPDDISAPGAWGTNAAGFMTRYPEFLISIESTYADSIISADISVETEVASTRNLKLGVYVVESHIIQWQEDYSEEESPVENYEHNHVLRASMNGDFGEDINTGNAGIAIGDEFTKSYTLKIGSDWVTDNIQLIAFVYDNDTKEVLQAEEAYLSE